MKTIALAALAFLSINPNASAFDGRWATDTAAHVTCDNGFTATCALSFSSSSRPDRIDIYDLRWNCGIPGVLTLPSYGITLQTGKGPAGEQIFVDWDRKTIGEYGFDWMNFKWQHYGPPTTDRYTEIKFQADGKAGFLTNFDIHKIPCRIEAKDLEPQFP